jgi:threonyl-tRNA synthetase
MKLVDAIGRPWQLATVQFDFNLPERFQLEYVAEDGTRKRPLMVHRVVYGSMERFFGVLIEHFAGAFPVWISPVQVVVIPISEKHTDYARQVTEQLTLGGEIFHQTADTVGGRDSTGFNLGGIYDFTEHHHLLFSAGRGVQNASDTNSFSYYIAYQLTF